MEESLKGRRVQQQFEEMLPDIEAIAGRTFRHLDPEAKEEAVAETVAECWRNYMQCVQKGKNPGAGSLAFYGVLGVRSGRKLAGSSSTDVLSRKTRMLGRATVHNLNAPAEDGGSRDIADVLADGRRWSRPLERVRVLLDYSDFLDLTEVTDQEREVMALLAEGHGTGKIAGRLGVSSPRICQVKNSLAVKLKRFMGRSIVPYYHALGGNEHSAARRG